MVKKIGKLVGQIDCPNCFSLLQWDSIDDVKVFNGNKFVVCPECGKNIPLDEKQDYWIAVEDDGSEEGDESGDTPGTRKAVVGTAIVGQDVVSEEEE